MAESNGNWLGSWFTAAKDKLTSSDVLESVRKDLEEIGGAVSKGATSVISSTGSVLEKTLSLDSPDSTANTVKRSISTFLDQVNTVFSPNIDDLNSDVNEFNDDFENIEVTKLQQILCELQKNEKTFLNEPEPHLMKQYECWMEIMDDQISDNRIIKYLNSSDVLKTQYEKLVPNVVDKESFWRRYLFKKALIEDELARQEIQEKKELKEKQVVEESVQWENENIELSEEEQIKLLEDYENETRIKNQQSPAKNKLEQPSTSKVKLTNTLEAASSSSSMDDDWEKITADDK